MTRPVSRSQMTACMFPYLRPRRLEGMPQAREFRLQLRVEGTAFELDAIRDQLVVITRPRDHSLHIAPFCKFKRRQQYHGDDPASAGGAQDCDPTSVVKERGRHA